MKSIYPTLIWLLLLSIASAGCGDTIGDSTPSDTTPADSPPEPTSPADGREVPCANGESTIVQWGVETCAEPDVFPASDVSQATIDLTTEWIGIGRSAWGNFGPVEIYIVGESVAAAKVLEGEFCTRHKALDPNWKEEWDCANDYHQIFSHYPTEGGAAVSDYRRNYLTYDFFTLTLSPKYPGPHEDDYKPVSLHEYFHVYHHSHISDRCASDTNTPCGRDSKSGGKDKPWFAEGSAEFMAQSLSFACAFN